jgi:hypothetical protein
MRRILTSALSALALGWLGGDASAQDKTQSLPRTASAGEAKGDPKGEPIPYPVQTVPAANSYCGPNGCYTSDCGWNQSCGDDCGGQRGSIIGGFGMYLIQPYFNTNPAYNTRLSTPTGTTVHVEQHDFLYNWDIAPEIWLGYVGANGFGARVRYFQYAQTANFGVTVPDLGGNFLSASTANPLGLTATTQVFKGDHFDFTSRLGILVWDFEFLQTWNPGCWQVTGSAGVRYAHVSQNYGVRSKFVSPITNEQPLTLAIDSGHSFNGAGPTVALEGRRGFGSSGLALYANARGSLLFGSDYQRAFRTTTFAPNDFGSSATIDAYVHESNVLPVAEAEIGAEFGRNIGPTRALLQIGFVGQAWFGAGNASNSQVVNATSLTNSPNNNSNLGLAGMVIRAGLSY